jgi:hypothetical protein
VEQHLESCGKCQQLYAEAVRLRELLPPVPPVLPRRDPWPRLAARIAERQEARRRRAQFAPRRLVRPTIALAMVAAVAAVVIALLGSTPRPLDSTGGTEALVENSEAGMIWSDPWAGEVAQALDWALSEQT